MSEPRDPTERELAGLHWAASYLRGLLALDAFGWGEMTTDEVLEWAASQIEDHAVSVRLNSALGGRPL